MAGAAETAVGPDRRAGKRGLENVHGSGAVGFFEEFEALDPERGIHGFVAGGVGAGDGGEKDVAGFLDEFLEKAVEDVGVDFIAGTGDGKAGAAAGVAAKGGEDGAEIAGGEFDAERDGRVAVLRDDGGNAFHDAFRLALERGDVLLARRWFGDFRSLHEEGRDIFRDDGAVHVVLGHLSQKGQVAPIAAS